MKKKLLLPILYCISILLFGQSLKATQHLINQDGPGLELTSKLMFNDERISDYTLIIYNENQTSDTIEVSTIRSIDLKLSYGHYYSLRYIKPGFLDRVVMIDTRINENIKVKDAGFDYEIEMIPIMVHGNTVADLPVAIIHFDITESKFEYSRNYHRQIRGKEITETDIDN